MKAPDKIYIQPDIEEDNDSIRTWLLSPFNDNSVPYIRKDALLGWAKGLYENTMTFVSGDIEKDNEIQMFALRISKHIESL